MIYGYLCISYARKALKMKISRLAIVHLMLLDCVWLTEIEFYCLNFIDHVEI